MVAPGEAWGCGRPGEGSVRPLSTRFGRRLCLRDVCFRSLNARCQRGHSRLRLRYSACKMLWPTWCRRRAEPEVDQLCRSTEAAAGPQVRAACRRGGWARSLPGPPPHGPHPESTLRCCPRRAACTVVPVPTSGCCFLWGPSRRLRFPSRPGMFHFILLF